MPQWVKDTMDEVARARAKFPGNKLCVTAFTEEHGEAVRAVLEHYYAPSPEKLADVRKELIQTIAMAVRLLEEGDPVHGLPANGQDLVGKECWVRHIREDWHGPWRVTEYEPGENLRYHFEANGSWWGQAKLRIGGAGP